MHRIGRTGRCGKTGIATTFVNKLCGKCKAYALNVPLICLLSGQPLSIHICPPHEHSEGACYCCGKPMVYSQLWLCCHASTLEQITVVQKLYFTQAFTKKRALEWHTISTTYWVHVYTCMCHSQRFSLFYCTGFTCILVIAQAKIILAIPCMCE